MKVKYVLEKGDSNQLIIQELSVLDKKDSAMFTLLCEETYEGKDIKSAISRGKQALVSELRTPNFYPQGAYADQIADLVMTMYGPEKKDSVEVVFDDTDLLTEQAKEKELIDDIEEAIEDETDELDELLEDDNTIKNLKTTIQVADEEMVDIQKDKVDDDLIV